MTHSDKHFKDVEENNRNYKPHSKFTLDEDRSLVSLVHMFGEKKWRVISKWMPNRNSRQCRERWKYYLNPNLNRDEWTEEEDKLIMKLFDEYGSRWMMFTHHFKERTDAMIKNRFNQLKRKQIKKSAFTLPSHDDHIELSDFYLPASIDDSFELNYFDEENVEGAISYESLLEFHK